MQTVTDEDIIAFIMNIEWFTKSASRGFQPKLSLRQRGQIGLNQGAVRKWRLQEYKFALVGFDKNSQTIAIKPTNDQEQKGVVKLRVNKQGTDATISAKAFFDYYEIECRKTLRLDAEWDDDLDAITAKMPEEKGKGGEDEIVI